MNPTCPHCGVTLLERGGPCPACGHPGDTGPPGDTGGDARARLHVGQRIAGFVLVANALLVVAESWLLDRPSSAGPTPGPFSAVFDLALGILLAVGSVRVLPWVKLRVVAGAVVFTALYVASGDAVMAALQLLFSLAVAALLFGAPGQPRIAVSLVTVGAVFALGIVGLQLELTGRNILGSLVMRLTEDLRPVEGGAVQGAAFPYRIAAPGEGWLLRAAEAARADNPLADNWLVHPDYDAHIIVIAESVGEPVTLPVDQIVSAVIENVRGAADEFQVHGTGPVESASGPGRLVDATGVVDGVSLHFHYGVFSFEGYAMQVVCFAQSAAFEHLADDFRTTIASLTLTE